MTADRAGAAPRLLTIATWNLLHGLSLRTGRVELALAAEVLSGLSADVIALQEVDRAQRRTGEVDQGAWLAAELGWSCAFAPALLGDPDRGWQEVPSDDPGGPAYGIALLSRFPLRRLRRTSLPGGGRGERARRATPRNPGWDREPRAALSAELGDPPLRVTTTHLSYLPWRGVAQLRAAAGVAGGDRLPGVLAGDLNLPAWTVRVVLGPAWQHVGGPPTYPSERPRLRPDQVLTTGGARIETARVVPAPTSDHHVLLARVTW